MVVLCLLLSLFVCALCDTRDGGNATRIPLNDGTEMPVIGLGTFLGFDENGLKKVQENEVLNPVTWALNSGYRMIDTAAAYKNEDQVGEAIRTSSVPRENIFVVTKLASNEQRQVETALRNSLARLNLTYVDLYLIHNPVAMKADGTGFDVVDYKETWRHMEEVKRLGLAKSIGLSNFNITQIEDILKICETKPTVLQVEVNLNLAQTKLLDFCKENNIAVMAYAPFGSLFERDEAPPPRVTDPTLVTIAEKYKKTVPQIVLRYLIQKGVAPIPKSVHKERIEENVDVFDFELTAQDMETLGKFNKNIRTVWPSWWQDHPYYPFERKDVPDPDIFHPKS